MKRYILISILILLTSLVIYFIATVTPLIIETRKQDSKFSEAFSQPKILDSIRRSQRVPRGSDLCGAAIEATVLSKGRDTLFLNVQYGLVVKRERCKTYEAYVGGRGGFIATNVWTNEERP